MKDKFTRETLLQKFVHNTCTPEEREQVLAYLKTDDADPQLHSLIDKELWEAVMAESHVNPQVSDEMYANISRSILPEKTHAILRKTKQNPLNNFFRTYWKLAAVCTGILLAAGVVYSIYFIDETISHVTAYGETTTITLPDQSIATLNGNSSVQYAAVWKKDSPRKVWVTGEVFFSVMHTANHQKFIVNTSDRVNVEVLGTEFNVYNRKNKTRVVLNSGKVQLNIQNQENNKQVTMTPGELVEFNGNPESYVKKDVNVEMYSAWMNKKLILDNTSFSEIAIILEETYGISVIVPDKSLYQEKFTGIVPCENASMLINALALSFNLNVYKNGNQVKFQAN